MARPTASEQPMRYPTLPAYRESVLPESEEGPIPWDLTAREIKKLADNSLTKALEIISNIF